MTIAPPETRDCDAEVPANEYNDRVDCRAQNINAATFAYVDSVLEHDGIRRALGGDRACTSGRRAATYG